MPVLYYVTHVLRSHNNPCSGTVDAEGAPVFDSDQISAYSTRNKFPQCSDKFNFGSASSQTGFTLGTSDATGDYEPEQLAQSYAWLANGYAWSISNTELGILALGGMTERAFPSNIN